MNKKILSICLFVLSGFSFATTASASLAQIAQSFSNSLVAAGVPLCGAGFAIAGILYLTSAGGSGMESAKKALVASAIGGIIVLLAKGASGFIGATFGVG